jgi:hypothetical protein
MCLEHRSIQLSHSVSPYELSFNSFLCFLNHEKETRSSEISHIFQTHKNYMKKTPSSIILSLFRTRKTMENKLKIKKSDFLFTIDLYFQK